MAIIGTLYNLGPFNKIVDFNGILLLQIFIGVAATFLMFLTSGVK